VQKWNFFKVGKVHGVKCTLQARLEYICFCAWVVCVCVVVAVEVEEVKWSTGASGSKIYVQVSYQLIASITLVTF